MEFHDALHDHQAKTRPSLGQSRFVGSSEKWCEEVLLILFADSYPTVLHREHERAALRRRSQRDHRLFARIFSRIAQQIVDHLRDPVTVPAQPDLLTPVIYFEGLALPLDNRRKSIRDLLQQDPDIELLLTQLERAGIQPRNIQEIVDKHIEPSRTPLHHPDLL